MRARSRVALVVVALAVLLTQFTNCDVYSDNSVFVAANSFSCTGTQCITANSDVLELAAPTELLVLSTQLSLDLGGDCNEAGYPDNRVTWNLMNAGTVLRTCTAVGACGKCVNGRYQVLVSFPGVPVTGWQVEVEIRGLDGTTEYLGRPTLAKRVVNIRIP